MSRKTTANIKKHNKKIGDKKRKALEAEVARKKRLYEIRQQFIEKHDDK